MFKKMIMTALVSIGFVSTMAACRGHVAAPGLRAGGSVGHR